MEYAHGSSGTVQQPGAGGPPTIDVRNANDLINALKPQNAGSKIRVMPGSYTVELPLVVPDARPSRARAG